MKKLCKKNKDIYICMTCDTEFLPPWYERDWINPSTWTFVQGVKNLKVILDRFDIKGTFFTLGTVAEKFPDDVKRLAAEGHLIGSHSYNHENYGINDVKVYTEQKPVHIKEYELKKKLLERTNNILKEVTGYEPKTFVAPFDNTDPELLKILDNLSIEVDCSYHNYTERLVTFPFRPDEKLKIIEVPLTVLKFGEKHVHNVIEMFTYDFELAKIKFDEYINSALENYPFAVVLLTCHPYEFTQVRIPHPRSVLIVGDEKIRTLEKLLNLFKERNYKFVNPLKIKQLFDKENKKYKIRNIE